MDGNSNPDGAKKRGGERFWGGFLFPFFVKTVKLKEKKRGDQNAIRHLSTKRITTKLSQQQIGLQLKGRSAPLLPSFYNPLFSNKFQEISGGWQAFSPYVPKNTPHVHTQAYASSADTRDTHSLHTASENGKLAYCIFLPQKSFGVYAAPCSQSTLAAQLHFTGS